MLRSHEKKKVQIIYLCWGMDTCLILLKDSGVVTENESPLVALFSLEELNGPIDEMWVTFSGAWLIPSVCNEKNHY